MKSMNSYEKIEIIKKLGYKPTSIWNSEVIFEFKMDEKGTKEFDEFLYKSAEFKKLFYHQMQLIVDNRYNLFYSPNEIEMVRFLVFELDESKFETLG